MNEPEGHIPVLPRLEVQQIECFIMITTGDAKLLLQNINIHKSPGLDVIHPRFLKELACDC